MAAMNPYISQSGFADAGQVSNTGRDNTQGESVVRGKAVTRGKTITLFQGVRPLERYRAVL